MFYSIKHSTRFRYSGTVSESIMEIRKRPRAEGFQNCRSFELFVNPRRRVLSYKDYLGNMVHHFDVPSPHRQLLIRSEALVDMQPQPPLPESLDPDSWRDLDVQIAGGDYWEMLMPSQFVQPTELLDKLARELNVVRRDDPMSLFRELNYKIYNAMEYVPKSTKVDSPIDEALQNRKGVCQDFTHIFAALGRKLGVPCRYVSGYLYHEGEGNERSSESATHAWVDVLLPGLGWVGFDPTNNQLAGERHIRTAIGRDYADVPPTKGVFKGRAQSELTVSVRVCPVEAPAPPEQELFSTEEWITETREENEAEAIRQQQQQQQQ